MGMFRLGRALPCFAATVALTACGGSGSNTGSSGGSAGMSMGSGGSAAGGSGGTSTGGTAGSTGGSAGTGGSSTGGSSGSGGSAGSTGGTAGAGGSAGAGAAGGTAGAGAAGGAGGASGGMGGASGGAGGAGGGAGGASGGAGGASGGAGGAGGMAGSAGMGGSAGSGGNPAMQSRLTVILPTQIEILAEDTNNNPLVFQAGAGFDHDSDVNEDIFMAEGDVLWEFSRTQLKFTNPTSMVDGGSNPITPNLMVAGDVQGTGARFIGIIGSDARIFNFTSNQFGAAFPLVETGSPPTAFTPIAIDTVDLTGTGAILAARKAGSTDLYAFNLAQAQFFSAGPPRDCASNNVIDADVILSAVFGGGPGETAVIFDGAEAYRLNLSGTTLCWDSAGTLMDLSGSPLVPQFGFGFDFDGNGTDEIVLVDTVPVP